MRGSAGEEEEEVQQRSALYNRLAEGDKMLAIDVGIGEGDASQAATNSFGNGLQKRRRRRRRRMQSRPERIFQILFDLL